MNDFEIAITSEKKFIELLKQKSEALTELLSNPENKKLDNINYQIEIFMIESEIKNKETWLQRLEQANQVDIMNKIKDIPVLLEGFEKNLHRFPAETQKEFGKIKQANMTSKEVKQKLFIYQRLNDLKNKINQEIFKA